MPRQLEVRGLSAFYGSTQALFGLDFGLVAGEITALLGANGAGKTTALRAISQMVRTAGSIVFDGEELAGKPTEIVTRRGVAHVPDGRGTFAALTVEENLRLGAITRRDSAAVAADMERMYNRFPRLGVRRQQQAGTLSGGEQQMLAIARAMLSRPRLLMLDEPSLGLAPAIIDKVYELLRRIGDQGVSLLVVEQNASRAFALADRAIVMNGGVFQLSGAPAEIERHEAFDAAYFGVAMTPGTGAA